MLELGTPEVGGEIGTILTPGDGELTSEDKESNLGAEFLRCIDGSEGGGVRCRSERLSDMSSGLCF